MSLPALAAKRVVYIKVHPHGASSESPLRAIFTRGADDEEIRITEWSEHVWTAQPVEWLRMICDDARNDGLEESRAARNRGER